MEDPTTRTEQPPASPPGTTVVGIGASAGGLAALKAFFAHVPAKSGLAFVVVVHLSPDHESHLAELLQPHVPMPVQQVTEDVPLEPNRVYVIPPAANLDSIDTHLRPTRLEERRRERAPIDHFFRTLASTHDGHSIGVILTGTGSDGTLGLREIREMGGLTVVQDPTEAEFDGMPQSAIADGRVDLVLPLAEIPDALLRFARTEPHVLGAQTDADLEAEERRLLHKVFAQIRAHTNRDFSQYKRSTLLRRISRRMQMAHLEEFSAYLDFLRESPDEVRALADDILINVTSFFRDPEVFESLEKEIVPQLFEGKGADESVRVWSVGCATGEEAYSLAMLLLEEAGRREAPPRIQVFASDLHERSLTCARQGFYPGDIEANMSPERLKRFFIKEASGYRIRQELRELVIFAPHNLLGDPPFSRIDLVSCRNLMIYLQRKVQQEATGMFHYALRPGGFLVLGTSETVDGGDLFETIHKQHCLFRRRDVSSPQPTLRLFPGPRVPLAGGGEREVPYAEPLGYGALHRRMVEAYAPPSLLMSPDDKVVHLSEHAGRFLVHPGGELTASAFKLVREEFRIELRSALHAARAKNEPLRSKPLAVRFNGELRRVVLDVRPAPGTQQEGFMLVIFDEREAVDEREPAPATTAADGDDDRVHELEAEIDLARQRLQAIIKEYETSQKEMKASNEELQSMNEELRSTMEELETSKEELQSMNEELQAVNQENRHKVEELGQLSSDLQNLFSSTDIATIFLDRELRILRFTPRVGELFNIRSTDRGRPLSDLTHQLRYDTLREDAEAVLRTLVPAEREVEDEAGRWYLCRVLPYRSFDDRIEGVVITFVEITTRKQAEDAVRASEARQAFLLQFNDALRPLADPVEVQAEAARVLGEHLGVQQAHYGETVGDFVQIHQGYGNGLPPMVGRFRHRDFGELLVQKYHAGETAVSDDTQQDPTIREAERAVLAQAGIAAYVAVPLVKSGEWVATLAVHSTSPRHWQAGEVALVEEVAERTWAAVQRALIEEALRQEKKYSESIVETLHEPLLILYPDLCVRTVNQAFYDHFGVREEETLGQMIYDLGNGQWDIPELRTLLEEVLPDNDVFTDYEVRHTFEDIGERVMLLNARRLDHVQFILLGIRDITERKHAEEALRESEEKYRLIIESARDYAIITADAEGTIESWSPGAEAVFGWSAEDIVGRPLAMTFTPEDQAAGVPEQEREIARREGAASDVRWHLCENGNRVFIEGMAQALRDDDGVSGFLKIGQDVTDRRQAEEALRESEGRFRQLAEAVPDVVFTTTPEGLVDYVSPRRRELIGHTEENALDTLMWPDLIHPDDQPHVEAQRDEAYAQQKPFQARYRLHTMNGDYRWFIARTRPIFSTDGTLVRWFGTLTDIDDLMRAEQALRRFSETLEQRVHERTEEVRKQELRVRELSRALTLAEHEERQRIAHVLHDDLQQVLAGAKMLASLQRSESAEAEGPNSLDQVLDEALEITRSLSHEMSPPLLRGEDLGDLLGWLVVQQRERHGLEVEVEVHGDARLPSVDLRVLVYQLLRELLFNVVKHADTRRARVVAEQANSHVRISVEDKGKGFDLAALTGVETGLGLPSVRERLELVGGRLEVASTPGRGTRMTLVVPTEEPTAE